MRPIVTDRVAWSVGVSVCHTREPCKNDWTNRDAVWFEDSGEPCGEPCIRWGPDSPWEWATLGKEALILKQWLSAVSCAKLAEPIDLPFRLWT